MVDSKVDYSLVIIGAGAAGFGASTAAIEKGIDHIVLEASHRTGGRGLTEYMEERIPVDLGCHWMHCASLNPYVKYADQLGFGYYQDEYHYSMFSHGDWLDTDKAKQFDDYLKASEKKAEILYRQSRSSPIIEAFDDQSEWVSFGFYWMSLMYSNDIDQVSVQDMMEFNETHENWPLKHGYGALIQMQGKNCPVSLNTQVEKINWAGGAVKLSTNKGVITSEKVIITVSTGVLGAGDMEFSPVLPESKRDAIDALPLGNSNYQFFSLDPDSIGSDMPANIHFDDGDVSLAIRMQPFGLPVVFSSTGGRFAWWLEKQGTDASKSYLENALVSIFGSDIRSSLRQFKVSAWGYDPLIRGAYSSQKPGFCDQRKALREPINEKLYFAGEATSQDFLNTAHGAFLSGQRAISDFCLRKR